MARTGKLTPEARDDHYREFDRLLGSPSASGPRRSKGACPPLSQITVPEEIFWLTVMLAQMRWPWPRDINKALADLPRSSRFSVEQARYLLRHDPELTALHAAKAGAQIVGWPDDLAAKALLEMARQRQSPVDDELTGRWPLPTGSERRQWEEDKNTFFRERHRHLTHDEKVAWLCLAYGQMGWPIPSLLTRFFPIDWTHRKMDSALLANIVEAISVADAVIADVQVKGLDRAGVLNAADSWASFERSREAEAKAGGIPAFVMFRDTLPRAGPQGRLYRRLFDEAQTVLQSAGQQPQDRLQLLDFLNRQTAVDGELARQKLVTEAAGEQGSHLGIRVSPPPAQRTAPKPTYPPPKVEPSRGIVYAPYNDDDDDDGDERDLEDNAIDVEDDGDGSATEGLKHEPLGEPSLGSSPHEGEPHGAETTEDARGDQLTGSIDEAREMTHDAGEALTGDPLSGHAPQAAEPLERGLGSTGSADTAAATVAAVDASADPGAVIDGPLADVASQVRDDGTGDEDRSAPTADVAVQADSADLQQPPASETKRIAGYGRSPEEPPPQDQPRDLGDHTVPSVDEASPVDDDWAYFKDPRNSFKNRRRQSTSAALPSDGHDDITSPESSLRHPQLQPTQSVPPADAVVGATEEVSGNVDDLGRFAANGVSAGSEIVSQPAALAPVATRETAGTADEVVSSQDVFVPAPSQTAEAQASSGGEHNGKRDADTMSGSAPDTPLSSDFDDAKSAETRRPNARQEEAPRHEIAHPWAVARAYRHDVAQTPGSNQPGGYEVERLSVRQDDRDDPA